MVIIVDVLPYIGFFFLFALGAGLGRSAQIALITIILKRHGYIIHDFDQAEQWWRRGPKTFTAPFDFFFFIGGGALIAATPALIIWSL